MACICAVCPKVEYVRELFTTKGKEIKRVTRQILPAKMGLVFKYAQNGKSIPGPECTIETSFRAPKTKLNLNLNNFT